MILKDFYTEKKSALLTEFGFYSTINPVVHLYTDTIFKADLPQPVIMFKYDTIEWETSSEKTYKADVDFCAYIVLPIVSTTPLTMYEEAFEMAHIVDRAILSTKNANAFIDTNSTFKVSEKQCTNEHEYWNKNDYFIWEITYKTTLIENTLKKRYTLLKNGASDDDLIKMGYAPLTVETTPGEGSNYVKIEEGKIKGNLYLNSVTSNNAAKEALAPSPETSVITNSDLDGDTIEDNTITLDVNGNVTGNETINVTDNAVSGNLDQVKAINLNKED